VPNTFQSPVTVEGYVHKTIITNTDIYSVISPVYYNGNSVVLDASDNWVTYGTTGVIPTYATFQTTAYSIGYTFQPGYNYFVTMNVWPHPSPNYYNNTEIIGLGISTGTPVFTQTR